MTGKAFCSKIRFLDKLDEMRFPWFETVLELFQVCRTYLQLEGVFLLRLPPGTLFRALHQHSS